MALDPAGLSAAARDFLTERHLATLTTLRPDGTPHVVPVGFTFDPGSQVARVITSGSSVKAANASLDGARASLCQLEGRHWLTLEGRVRVQRDADAVRDAEERYAVRYRVPRENPARVVLVVEVDRVLGSPPPLPM